MSPDKNGTRTEAFSEAAGEEGQAQMARYHFHCTNGLECVFDAVGNEIRAPERLPRRAEQVAQSVMRSLHASEDWSKWHVSAHRLSGRRVLVQPFIPQDGELNQAA